MADRNRWAETQIADLVESGTDPLDAEKVVADALAAIPAGEDPATYTQTPAAAAADANITEEDIADARADWYASDAVPQRYKRILDAREKEER